MSEWYYRKQGLLDESTEGPITDNDFLQLTFDGKLKLDTLVTHPRHTKAQWVKLGQIPAAKERLEAGEAERHAMKEREKEVKAKERTAAAARRDVEIARRAADAEAVRAANKQQRMAEEQHASQLKTRVGSDRWPNMFRCAKVYEVIAIFIAIIVGLNLLVAAAWPLLAGLASLASGSTAGIGAGIFLIILGLVVGVGGAVVGYLMFISMMCWAELLRCFAAIEANTRTMWAEDHSESDK